MSLAGALQAARDYTPPTGPRCTVCRVLLTISAEDRDLLLAALDDEALLSTAIAAALQSEGHEVKPLAVQRHRRGACRGLA